MTITEQNNSTDSRDVELAACGYLLHTLLQRLDQQQPGLIADLIEGISNDQAHMKTIDTREANEGVEVAEVVLRRLRLMAAQLKML